MLKRIFLSALFMVLAAGTSTAAGQPAPPSPAKESIWQEGGRHRPEANPKAEVLPLISVKGNRFVDQAGATMLFRGLSVADPDRLVEQGRWNRELFVAVRDMGANLVRIPVHPAAWRSRTKQGYLKLLDQAVDWCTAWSRSFR